MANIVWKKEDPKPAIYMFRENVLHILDYYYFVVPDL